MTRFLPIALAIVACTSDATGPEGALEKALAHARPDEPRVSADAPATPSTRVDARLTIAFTRAEGRHELTLTRQVDRKDRMDGRTAGKDGAGGGAWRVLDERAYTSPAPADPTVAQVARESVETRFDGTVLVWKRGDGQWIERDVLDGLAERTLANALELGDFTVAAFGDYFRVTPRAADREHPATLGGEPVSWSSIDLDPAVRPRALDEDALVALRDRQPLVVKWIAATHRPTHVHGDIARDRAGALVAARLTIQGTTAFPEGAAPFSLELEQSLGAMPEGAPLELPAERLSERRERPWRMIESVLGKDLLPPYR